MLENVKKNLEMQVTEIQKNSETLKTEYEEKIAKDNKEHEQAVFEMDKQLTGKEFRIMDLEQKVQELERDRANLNDAFENQGTDFINLKSSFHETQESQQATEKRLKNLDCEINLMRYELQGCREQIE